MSGGYVICEYNEVKEGFPEFKRSMDTVTATLLAKAAADWSPLKDGRMFPVSGQFGRSTIMPQLFRNVATTTMVTWDQTFTTTGHQTIMSGANGGNIYRDYKIGLVGLAFLSKAIRIAEIRMQISDKKIGRINIEEAMAYKEPAIIFEDGFVLDENTGFDLYAYVLSQGEQRIKLIGLELNKVPNKLQVTDTGAALT